MTIPAGFIQITHRFGGTSQPNGAAIVYGIEDVAGFASAALAAQAAHTQFGSIVMPELSTTLTLQSTLAKFGPDDVGPTGEYASSIAGGTGADPTSPNTTFLVTKQTAIGGKRSRGRLYLPGLGEAWVDPGGVILGTKITSLQADLDTWLDDLQSLDMPMMLLHEPATEWALVNGQPRRVPTGDPPPAPSVVTSLVLSSKAGTQRRRMRR